MYDDYKLAIFVEAIKTEGFQTCDDGEWEDGFRKIAIFYDKKDEFTHAVLLVSKGVWKSKWGRESDFVHSLNDVHSHDFGNKCVFMKRPDVAVVATKAISASPAPTD